MKRARKGASPGESRKSPQSKRKRSSEPCHAGARRLRADTTDVLNKGEARHTLTPAAAFHRLGRFRDRSHDQHSHRAAALDRAVDELRRRGVDIDAKRLRRLSPLGWDHINLTGDYVWSDTPPYDGDGMRPRNRETEPLAA